MLKDIISKLRKYEILIRKAVNTSMQGESHSVFKGSGLEFDDVRQYNYGDDVRTINWNISAKGHGAYINTYKEEKEQNVFFVLDVSASQRVGAQGLQNLEIGKEICGELKLSAMRDQNSVGLLCFSDKKERYVRPDKGNRQAAQILKVIFDLNPSSDQTNLSKAITMAMNIIKRKSVMILVSDFIDEDVPDDIKYLQKRHDVNLVHIFDRLEFSETGDVFFSGYSPEAAYGPIRFRPDLSREHFLSDLKDRAQKLKINLFSYSTITPATIALRELFYYKRLSINKRI